MKRIMRNSSVKKIYANLLCSSANIYNQLKLNIQAKTPVAVSKNMKNEPNYYEKNIFFSQLNNFSFKVYGFDGKSSLN